MGTEAKNLECNHCHSYHATKDGLCGNCLLKSPEARAAELKFKSQIEEGRKRADAAAKQAFIDEMRKINEENVDLVVGGSHDQRVKEAK
jgi:hypothetical protein